LQKLPIYGELVN